MHVRRQFALLMTISALLTGACTSPVPAQPTPVGTSSAPTPQSPTTAPPPAATPSDDDDQDDDDGDDDDDDGAGAPHQVPDLEAMLPSEVLGSTVSKISIRGPLEDLQLSDEVAGAIAAAGGTTGETELAIGTTEDQSLLIIAVRVPGMQAQGLLDAIVANNDPAVLPVREGRIAGKEVVSLGDSQFFHARGDVLFSVLADVNTANETISQLP